MRQFYGDGTPEPELVMAASQIACEQGTDRTWVALPVERYLSNAASFVFAFLLVSRITIICYIILNF